MSAGLISEFLVAAEAVTPAVDRAMARAGICFIHERLPRYGIARIRIDGDLFVPDEDGLPALITTEWFGAVGCGLALVDLVAMDFNRPSQPYRRLGYTDILGDDAVATARIARSELTIFRSPFSWLAGGGRGACLINWSADPRYVFRGVGQLRCETDQIARRLAARVAECSLPAPRISVGRQYHRRAA